MMKQLAVLATGLFATQAFADMCYVVEDAYSPAAYRVMYYGGPEMAHNAYAVTAIAVTQVRHSGLTAGARSAAVSNLPLMFKEEPDLGSGEAFLGGYQNGAYIDMEIDGGYDQITIWHKFVTASGDFHEHVAGDVRGCTSEEFMSGVSVRDSVKGAWQYQQR